MDLNETTMTGKTIDEAIEKALKLLRVGKNEVVVDIVDEGKKGFFGIGQRPAKIIVKLKQDPAKEAKRFIREVSTAMGLDVAVSSVLTDKTLTIDLKGQNIGVLIGKHGQTLDSLQYLTNLVVNKNKENYVNVQIDTENYRAKRKETLEVLARNIAKKVRQTKRSVRLEPMSPAERRVIHAALQGERQVSTFSEGIEPFRNVVVSFKKEMGASGARGSDSNEKSGEYGKSFGTGKQRSNYNRSGSRSGQNKDNYKKFINMNNKSNTENED